MFAANGGKRFLSLNHVQFEPISELMETVSKGPHLVERSLYASYINHWHCITAAFEYPPGPGDGVALVVEQGLDSQEAREVWLPVDALA